MEAFALLALYREVTTLYLKNAPDPTVRIHFVCCSVNSEVVGGNIDYGGNKLNK